MWGDLTAVLVGKGEQPRSHGEPLMKGRSDPRGDGGTEEARQGELGLKVLHTKRARLFTARVLAPGTASAADRWQRALQGWEVREPERF